jgi:hypothetical protein
MKLETTLIDLDCLVVNQQFDEPDSEQVTYLAHSIASLGGMIQIPVVKQLDIETFELIKGYFEYQAYLKARELNPDLPDRMRVFIITPKNEAAIQQQLKVLESLSSHSGGASGGGEGLSQELNFKLNNLASAIELLQRNVKETAVESQTAIIEALDERILKPLPPLEAFNRIQELTVAKQVLDNLQKVLRDSKAQQIVLNLQTYHQASGQPLESFVGVIDAVGKDSRGRRYLTEKTMVKVIDTWS